MNEPRWKFYNTLFLCFKARNTIMTKLNKSQNWKISNGVKLLRALLIIGILFSYTPVFGAEEALPEAAGGNYITLSLNKVLELALINNFDVQLALYDRNIKETDIDKTKSIYDTVLKLSADYGYDKSAKPSVILGSTSHTGNINAEVSKKFITGTDVTVGYGITRESTDSAFTSLNPLYESALEMTFTQPLLYNFFGMQDWGEVRIARIDVRNFDLETLDKIEQNLADVEKAYWDVVLALKLVEVGERMYKRAEDFYNINVTKADLGTSETADLLDAEANMESRRTELEVEKDTLMTTINKLKLLVNHPETEKDILPIGNINIQDEKVHFIPSLRRAFEKRRDYKRARDDIKSKDIKFDMKRNARWPELDLEGSLRLNGIERMPGSAAGATFSDRNPDYYAKVTFSFPFEDRSARSEYDAAKNEKAKVLVNFKKTEKTIVTEIDDRVREVNVNINKAKQRMRIEVLQKKKLSAEEKQYEYGRSNSDTIVRFQQDLLQAKIAALRALREYKDSMIDLYVAENIFLEKRSLTVQ